MDTSPNRKFEDVVLNAGLYEIIEIKPYLNYFYEIAVSEKITIDCHCVGCNQLSTFKKDPGNEGVPGRLNCQYAINNPTQERVVPSNKAFTVIYLCQRDPTHKRFYLFYYDNTHLQKIGQFPSIADTASADIRRFRPVLQKKLFGDLNRAVGLYAHGIGAGAFVYLRRIFESLISAERDSAREEGQALEGFEQLRLSEKVDAIKDRLPIELLKMRSMYGILSAGIHELDEDTCRKMFPAMLAGIELILDGHLEAITRKKHVENLERALAEAALEVSQAQNQSKGS